MIVISYRFFRYLIALFLSRLVLGGKKIKKYGVTDKAEWFFCYNSNRKRRLRIKTVANNSSLLQKKSLYIDKKIHKRINKNTPKNIDLNLISYQFFNGIDLYAIEGFSHGTVLTLISEIGEKGILKFQNAQHFTSWLRLAPNNKISGGRVISTRTPKGSNRLKIALRQAANAIGNLKDTHLSNFFNRIAYRKGRTVAISATARKLATILWNMIFNNQQYNPPTIYEYLDQKRKKKVLLLQKQIAILDARMSKSKTI